MNILFHTATAIATVVLVTNAEKPPLKLSQIAGRSFLALSLGIIFHGMLDYIPHRYPINPAIDVIMSLLVMIIVLFKAIRRLKIIVVFSFLGNILPDLLDLAPSILNKYLHFNLPTAPKIFPWHWPQYSGSIYTGCYAVSALNHLLVLTLVLIICLVRYRDFKAVFIRK